MRVLDSGLTVPRRLLVPVGIVALIAAACSGDGDDDLGTGLDLFYQQVTLGVILLLAVGLDAWSRRAD